MCFIEIQRHPTALPFCERQSDGRREFSPHPQAHATLLFRIAHIAQNKDRERAHAPPLFGSKCLIQGLPCFGELIEIG
jgi:hypothetical protein